MANKRNYILLFTFILTQFSGSVRAQANHQLKKEIATSFTLAANQLLKLHQSVGQDVMPRTLNPDKTLRTNKPDWWTSGFFPGSLWYTFEFTKNDLLKQAAIQRTDVIENEKLNDGDHDIGFKIMCSFGNKFRITRDSSVIPVIVTAAKSLSKRFNPVVGSIRSWGAINETKNYLVIIDNMMNLELLFAATKLTGDSSYYKIAVSHANKTLANHYRQDGSSYHVVEYNQSTGEVTKKRTHQGYSDESAWARGQAWGLYGYVTCYRETRDKRYLNHAIKIANFLIQHPNFPKDKIPYWDYNAPNIPYALRDASAGAILASALLELSKYAHKKISSSYFSNAELIIKHLNKPPFRTKISESHNFLLNHGVGHLTAQSEVDVPLSYADYYYLEAMKRYLEYNNRRSR